jgi:hypothetical protein
MFQYEFGKPQGIFLTQNGVVCPRHTCFHYMLTPSNSFLLGHWAGAGMHLPQSDIELPSLVLVEEIVVVHFEKRTSAAALTLEENGIGLRH